jgi:putative transposase
VYRFVEAEKATFPVATMCRVLGVAPSGYWAWRSRGPSARTSADAELTAAIHTIHRDSRGTYGAPRVHAELRDSGTRCGRKRIARLMRTAGLVGVHRRRYRPTTVRDADVTPAPDLLGRDFSASGPDRLWVADITALPTQQGELHLAVVLDAWSRQCVGWSMHASASTELVIAALDMALAARGPVEDLIFHSDHGTQYTSGAFGRRCEGAGIVRSMGSVGDSYDNAMAESFFASLETELIDRSSWRTRAEARAAVFDWISTFYNRRRRHSALGYLPPEAFEARYRLESAAA